MPPVPARARRARPRGFEGLIKAPPGAVSFFDLVRHGSDFDGRHAGQRRGSEHGEPFHAFHSAASRLANASARADRLTAGGRKRPAGRFDELRGRRQPARCPCLGHLQIAVEGFDADDERRRHESRCAPRAGDADVQDCDGFLPRNGGCGGRCGIDGTDAANERGPPFGRCDLSFGGGHDEDLTNHGVEVWQRSQRTQCMRTGRKRRIRR